MVFKNIWNWQIVHVKCWQAQYKILLHADIFKTSWCFHNIIRIKTRCHQLPNIISFSTSLILMANFDQNDDFFVTFCIKGSAKISARTQGIVRLLTTSHSCAAWESAKHQWKAAPPSWESLMSICQPWVALSCCTTARPKPLPPVLWFREASNR